MKINLTLLFLLLISFCWSGTALSWQSAVTPAPAVLRAQVRVDNQKELVERLRVKLQNAAAETEKLKAKKKLLIESQTKLGVSKSSFSEIMKSLQSQKIQLTVDIAGLEARQAAILASQKKGRVKVNHEIVAPLKKLLEMLEKEQIQMQKLFEKGATSDAELRKSKRAVIEAKIRLAQASSASQLTDFDRSLLDTSLELAEKRARLSKTKALLKEVVPAIDLMEEIQDLEFQLKGTNATKNELATTISKARETLAQLVIELEAIKQKHK